MHPLDIKRIRGKVLLLKRKFDGNLNSQIKVDLLFSLNAYLSIKSVEKIKLIKL